MPHIEIIKPANGSRLVQAAGLSLLVGQPPEVLKGLKLAGQEHIDGIVLTDTRERDGSLMNHVEFLLYHFLFSLGGYKDGKKLLLIGEAQALLQTKRLLKFTLLGPDPDQLIKWGTDLDVAREWLAVSNDAALARENGSVLQIDDFFESHPYTANQVQLDELLIERTGADQYRFTSPSDSKSLDLNQDTRIYPAYQIQKDYQTTSLAKFSLDVLGGASGFSPNEPCTGLVLCHNGEYVLIDSIPFLDEHLLARGISKNQISACFLTHIHDDHCALLPLMQTAHVIELISTCEIYEMAMEKLALGLGWKDTAIREHFRHIPITLGHSLNYYGLLIQPHNTVHSIPTIGATFTVREGKQARRICLIGDNHSLRKIEDLHRKNIVRTETLTSIRNLYQQPFDLLIADGGGGPLHGDPAEFMQSPAERIVFVHLDILPKEFTATFSKANSGKRYNLINGDSSLYSALIQHYLKLWIGEVGSNRWLRSLVTNSEVKNYNRDDVILVQDQPTHGYVYLILTGYCSVIHQDGEHIETIATLQAGELIGEMAPLTSLGVRNASVLAKTPVTVCRFSEDAFTSLSGDHQLRAQLNKRWQSRPILSELSCFQALNSTVIEKISAISTLVEYPKGTPLSFDDQHLYFKLTGKIRSDHHEISDAQNLGWQPFEPAITGHALAVTSVTLLTIDRHEFETIRLSTPQLNYQLRKHVDTHASYQTLWTLRL